MNLRKRGNFTEGTVLVKEAVGVASKQSLSGNGYFMGDFIGLVAMVKDAVRFPEEPDHCAFFRFKTAAETAPLKQCRAHPTAACSACHKAGSQERVFVRYYPVLKSAKYK